jgi:outer membrane protein
MRGRRSAIAGFLAALLTPTVVSAANDGPRAYASAPPVYDWTITLGAEGRYQPVFQGSDKDRLIPNPIFAVRRFGTPEPFRGPRDGAGVGLIGNSVFQIGPVGELNLPRREQQDPQALRGLGNIPWVLELGVFAEYWAVPWLRTRAEIRQGVHGHHGIVSDIFVDAVVPVGPQWTFSGGPRVTLATAPATGPYFGIDAAQSLASGLPIFDAKGGVRSVGAGTQARYFWTPQLATHGFVEYERLMGDAASSPLVAQRGTPDQLTIGFGATYSIDIKSPW